MDDAAIINFAGQDIITDPLTDLLRKGSRELLQAAVEAERDAFLAEFQNGGKHWEAGPSGLAFCCPGHPGYWKASN